MLIVWLTVIANCLVGVAIVGLAAAIINVPTGSSYQSHRVKWAWMWFMIAVAAGISCIGLNTYLSFFKAI